MTDLTDSKKDEHTVDTGVAGDNGVARRGGGDGRRRSCSEAGPCRSRRRRRGIGCGNVDGDNAAGTEDAENASSEAETAGDGDDDVSSMDAMVEQYDEATRTLSAGQIVEGRVVEVRDDEVIVYVGYKSEGRIPASELGLAEGQVARRRGGKGRQDYGPSAAGGRRRHRPLLQAAGRRAPRRGKS